MNKLERIQEIVDKANRGRMENALDPYKRLEEIERILAEEDTSTGPHLVHLGDYLNLYDPRAVHNALDALTSFVDTIETSTWAKGKGVFHVSSGKLILEQIQDAISDWLNGY